MSELVSEQAHLPAVMGLMRDHVGHHLQPDRPSWSPAIPVEHLDAPRTKADRFFQHLRAAVGARSEARACCFARAVRPVQLRRNSKMRCCEPDPLTTDVVQMHEDRGDGTHFPRRNLSPDGRVKLLQQDLSWTRWPQRPLTLLTVKGRELQDFP